MGASRGLEEANGPVWLLLLAGLGGWYYQYRKGNPEKT